jgi:hypothetical protein
MPVIDEVSLLLGDGLSGVEVERIAAGKRKVFSTESRVAFSTSASRVHENELNVTSVRIVGNTSRDAVRDLGSRKSGREIWGSDGVLVGARPLQKVAILESCRNEILSSTCTSADNRGKFKRRLIPGALVETRESVLV